MVADVALHHAATVARPTARRRAGARIACGRDLFCQICVSYWRVVFVDWRFLPALFEAKSKCMKGLISYLEYHVVVSNRQHVGELLNHFDQLQWGDCAILFFCLRRNVPERGHVRWPDSTRRRGETRKWRT